MNDNTLTPENPIENNESEPIKVTKPSTRNTFWLLYIGVLIVGVGGLLLTHSGFFPLLIFISTFAYLGFQLVVFVRQISRVAVTENSDESTTTYNIPVLSTLTASVSLGLFILSTALFRPGPDNFDRFTLAFLVAFAGGISFLVALAIFRTLPNTENKDWTFSPALNIFPPTRVLLTTVGILMLLIEAEISGAALGLTWLSETSFWIQGLLFWGGILITAMGLAGTTGIQRVKNIVQRLWERNYQYLAIVLILIFALVVRVWALENALPLSIDDGANLPGVWALLGDKTGVGLVLPSNDNYTTQVFYQFVSTSIHVFGFDFEGARMVDVIFGTLGVLAVFILADTLFNRKTALVAALILATFPPHLQFSRIILGQIVDGTFGAFAIAFLARGFKYNQRADWVLAGITLGLTQYFSEAGRLFFPPLIALWLIYMAIVNFKTMRRFINGIGVFLMAALLAAMPTYYALFAQNSGFTKRLNISGVGIDYWIQLWKDSGFTAVLDRFESPFLAFVHYPDIGLFYGGYHAMVLEYAVPFFLIGIFIAIWYWRKPQVIIGVWIMATGSVNLFMRDTTSYPRYVVGFPAVALAITLGICYVIPMLLATWERRSQQIMLGTLVLAICVANTLFYFDVHLPDLRYQIRNSKDIPDSADATLRSVNFPARTDTYMVSRYVVDVNIPRVILSVYLWNTPDKVQVYGLSDIELTPDFLSKLPHDRNYAFFLEPGNAALVDNLKQDFVLNDPQFTQQSDMPPNKGFVLYFADQQKQGWAASK
jgi:4-amino-4-deoxy-L-arabinose transferase-like glycosyltransferase